MVYNPCLFIITGGPGSGKTTLLEELEKKGFQYIPEVARQIIMEQMNTGGVALPWKDAETYTKLMLSRSIETFSANADTKRILFSDRGIPDTAAYARLIKSGAEKEAREAASIYRYNPAVFILPPWEEIYQTDTERKQTFEEAVDTYDILCETYTQLAYQLNNIPRLPIKQRADFVLATLRELLKNP